MSYLDGTAHCILTVTFGANLNACAKSEPDRTGCMEPLCGIGLWSGFSILVCARKQYTIVTSSPERECNGACTSCDAVLAHDVVTLIGFPNVWFDMHFRPSSAFAIGS